MLVCAVSPELKEVLRECLARRPNDNVAVRDGLSPLPSLTNVRPRVCAQSL